MDIWGGIVVVLVVDSPAMGGGGRVLAGWWEGAIGNAPGCGGGGP
jgi:hypothetical protein